MSIQDVASNETKKRPPARLQGKQRQNLNIELADGSKEQLESIRSWNGMTQKELVGRLITWFCTQDRVIQQVILGQIPDEIAPDVAALVLERLAAQRDGAPADEAQPHQA